MAEVVTPTTPAAPVKNGAAPATPQQPIAPQPQTPDELATTKAELAKYRDELGKKTREGIAERRKHEAQSKTWGERLKRADEYDQIQKHASVNPEAVAKKLWGDTWFDKLMAVKANGGAPTADSIAFEMEQREQALRKEFDEREQKQNAARSEAEQKANVAQLRAFNSRALDFAKESAKDYPIFDQFKSNERIAGAIVARIREVHDATVQRDSETGEYLGPGRMLTFKEAAEAIETDLIAIANSAAAHEKYQQKLREKLTPAKLPANNSPVVKSTAVPGSSSTSQQQPRRTLSNDLTGSTPGEPPKHRSEEERIKAALAAYEANRRKE